MAQQITTLPSPPQRTDDQQTFALKGDALLSALPAFVTQSNAQATEVETNKNAAAQSATNAATSATTAGTKAGDAATSATNAAGSATAAATSAGNASGSATAAATSATNAATSATQSAQSALGLIATSTSSVSIGVGTKTFNVGTGKSFIVNAPVLAVSAVDATQYIYGTVNSYGGSSLVINVTDISGGGTYANWNISVSSIKGPIGLSGNLTGALNMRQSASIAVSATPNIWSGAGNTVVLTGAGTITSFTDAPQTGATRKVVIQDGCSITTSANLNVYGGSLTLAAGDLLEVVCEGAVNKFRVTVMRADGSVAKNTVRPFFRAHHRAAVGDDGQIFAATNAAATVDRAFNQASNTIPGAAMASVITLPAGTYSCNISANVYCTTTNMTFGHKIYLYNNTDNTVVLEGESRTVTSGTAVANYYPTDVATVRGTFTISAAKTFVVKHFVTNSASIILFGKSISTLSSTTNEIYAVAEFWKEA